VDTPKGGGKLPNMSCTDLRLTRVSVVHPRCGASSHLDSLFDGEAAFASDDDEVAFARGASQLRLVEADPYLNELLVRYCKEALSRRTSPASSIPASVENAIASLLTHGRVRAGARHERTHVGAAPGRGEPDIFRNSGGPAPGSGASLPGRCQFPISHIAWRLGFQEVSAFTHAFKRWTGQTPTQMRFRITAQTSSAGDAGF
jgi:AraC-like DNA-binding protein